MKRKKKKVPSGSTISRRGRENKKKGEKRACLELGPRSGGVGGAPDGQVTEGVSVPCGEGGPQWGDTL